MFNYSLRPAAEEHVELIYAWRNRPEVRAFMYSSHEISFDEHACWFAEMLKDPSKLWLILNYNQQDCAVIYFSGINGTDSCSWGFYAAPYAPPGISLIIELAGLEYAFENLSIHRLNCEVLSGNTQVINLHRKSGFTQEGLLRQARNTVRGIEDVFLFSMNRNSWPVISRKLKERAIKIYARSTNEFVHNPVNEKS